MSVNGLRPYPAYRDSGVEWLGKVPEHWEVRRTKTVLKQRTEKGFPNEPLLAATQTKGVVRKEQYENRTVLALKDLHLLKLVQVGDFVISLRSFQGGIEFARERGIISPAYTVLFPVQSEDHGYLAHLFKSAPYVENLSLFVTGIRQGQNIDYAKLGRSRLPLPPTREQRAIARFLEAADRRIRRYIRAKERLIELLQERKRALIHEAVTGRTDVSTGQPYPAYKDSGVEWLGKVPQHWEVKRLKYLTRFVNGFAFKPSEWRDEGTPIIRIENLNGGNAFNYTDRTDLPDELLIQTGDIVFAWSGNRGTSFGSFRWDRDFDGWLNQHIFKLTEYALCRGYFFHLLRAVTKKVEDNAHGIIGLVHITKPALGAIAVPVAPAEEQAFIAAGLDEKLAKIDRAARQAVTQIRLLEEYRTRLIADVVTGKLDVREAAARLPGTDPLSADRNRAETIPPESNLHSTADEIAKEASA